MRLTFAKELLRRAIADEDIFLLAADLGYGMFDGFQSMLPERYINTGAAEQAMLDVAVGLALAGKKPVCYTISPFYYRGFETIRTYIAHESLPVLMVGSGRNKDYEHDGISHDASDMQYVLGTLKVRQYYPSHKDEIPRILDQILNERYPAFLSLRR